MSCQTGKSPVADFLGSLNAKQAMKVTWVLYLIENSKHIPIEYFKKLTGTSGIWEVRVQSESNIFRLLGFIDSGRFVVLTNGFQKVSENAEKRNPDW